MRAQRFILACMFVTVLSLLTVAAVNYAVDVNRVYHAKDEAEQTRIAAYVERLLASQDGMVQTSWDRAVKWELARQSQADCFVTGSSRAMIFGQRELTELGGDCLQTANLAVSGAGFEDFVTALGLIADKPGLKTLYAGIDPWLLRFGADARYTQFSAIYRGSRSRLGLSDRDRQGGWERWANLINGQYFLSNLRLIADGKAALPEIKQVAPGRTNVKDNERILLPDGSQIPSRRYTDAPSPPDAQVGKGSDKIMPPYIEAGAADEFSRILDRLQARGVNIVFLLAPYHPKVMTCLSQKACAAMRQVEAWVRAQAAQRNGRVIGSFDPRPFGMGPELFHDDKHMRAEAIGLLARETGR